MLYHVMQAPSFWDCVHSRRHDDYKAALVDTLTELGRKPFQNPKLNTHGVGEASNGKKVFASDVGGRRSDRRIVWQLFNRTILVLLYGTHKVYDRVRRMRVDFDWETRAYTVFEAASDSPVDEPYQRRRDRVGKLFMAWTDAELASFGFPPAVVANLRRVDVDFEFLEMEDELGPYFERAYNLLAHGHPDGADATVPIFEVELEPLVPDVTEDDRTVERGLADDRKGGWFTSIEPEFLTEILQRPIEDWMIFLHPDQRAAVRRRYAGPARVRGPAGTGKTVVGLHRTAWLAERNRRIEAERREQLIPPDDDIRPILFTTFIKSLPPVFEALYLRMPGTRAGEVEFINVNSLAWRVCAEAGDRLHIDNKSVEQAFTAALARVVTPGTPLAERGFSKQYLREEITAVIKGRAIAVADEYFGLARTGRRAPMSQRLRSQVWELRRAWDREMAERGALDFSDVILRALQHARKLDEPRYSAVVVDEAQDLTMAGLQLLRALVNAPHPDRDRPNGILILGDGAQRIYPGGYTLRQAGVEVRGRTTVLDVNYRNTDRIIEAAMAVAGDVAIDDLGEDFRRADQRAGTARRGSRPLLIRAKGLDAQLDEIVRLIGELTTAERAFGPGDIAVLVPWNSLVKKACNRVNRTRFQAQRLDNYDGRSNDRVKVGTYHRGKGLEFKVVFLPKVTRGYFPSRPRRNQTIEEAAETRELEISQLFVAMTRARDLLVVLHDGAPSEVIVNALDHFERREAVTPQQPLW